jgi:hypothetical protein
MVAAAPSATSPAGRAAPAPGGAVAGGESRGPAEPATLAAFSAVAAGVAECARALGLRAPAFRSPPRVPGADRTLRRQRDGSAVVAVRVRGRSLGEVVADIVEGVVAANGLGGAAADDARRALAAALGPGPGAAPPDGAPASASGPPRRPGPVAKVHPRPGGGTGQTRPP